MMRRRFLAAARLALAACSWAEDGYFGNTRPPGKQRVVTTLDLFTRPDGHGTHWTDPQYQAMLANAKSIQDDSLRMVKLAQCERRLLEGMPILPLGHWMDAVLRKPFLRGIWNNLLDWQQFKYVWIDTNWRPS